MNKGIYRIAAGVGAAVILVSSATAQAATVTANGTPAPVASDSIAGWPAAPLSRQNSSSDRCRYGSGFV